MNTTGVKQALAEYIAVARLRLVVKPVEHHSADNRGGYQSSKSRKKAGTGSFVVTMTAGSIRLPQKDADEIVNKVNANIKSEVERVFGPLIRKAVETLEEKDPLEGATDLERILGIYSAANGLQILGSPPDNDGLVFVAPSGNGVARFDKQDWNDLAESTANYFAKINTVISEAVKKHFDRLKESLVEEVNKR